MGIPTVAVIGSCRVRVPLNTARKNKLLKVYSNGLESFCHSIKEVSQKLEFATKKITFPEHLDVLINGKEVDKNLPFKEPLDFKKADVFVIEISTIKQLEIEGYQIQQNYFMEYFIKPNKLEAWWRELVKLANEKGSASFAPKADWISEDVRSLAAKAVLSINTEQDIINEAKKITAHINRPVIFVGHFNITRLKKIPYVYNLVRKLNSVLGFTLIKDTIEAPIRDRVILHNILVKAAKAANAGYYQPADFINQHGKEKALMEGKTTNHWAKAYCSVYGEHLVKEVIEPYLEPVVEVAKIQTATPALPSNSGFIKRISALFKRVS